MNFILFLAKRYLSRTGVQGLRSWLIIVSTVGIFLASFMVLVALGVLAGYQRVYHKAVLGFSAHLIIFNSEGLTDGDQQEITGFLKQSKMANVFSPYHFYETIAPSEDGPKPIIFKGVDETKMRQMYPIEFEDLPAGSSNNVFVGKDVLVRQPEPTSQGQLNYLTNPHLGSERKTTLKSMPLQGIFKSGYYDFDYRFVIMPLKFMHATFFDVPLVSGIEVRLDDIKELVPLRDAFLDHFGGRFAVMTWDEMNASLLNALKIDRTVVWTISFLIVLIACLNIFGFNFLFFVQRKREFLILSALGLSLPKSKDLLALLSVVLGGVAAALGALAAFLAMFWMTRGAGIPLDARVYYVEKVPVYFECVWFSLFFLLVILLCFITSRVAGKVVISRYVTSTLKDSA